VGRVGVGVVFGWDACQCLVSVTRCRVILTFYYCLGIGEVTRRVRGCKDVDECSRVFGKQDKCCSNALMARS
jgi:hypothetical protein